MNKLLKTVKPYIDRLMELESEETFPKDQLEAWINTLNDPIDEDGTLYFQCPCEMFDYSIYRPWDNDCLFYVYMKSRNYYGLHLSMCADCIRSKLWRVITSLIIPIFYEGQEEDVMETIEYLQDELKKILEEIK